MGKRGVAHVDTEPCDAGRCVPERRNQIPEFFAINVPIAVLVIVREERLVLLDLFCAGRIGSPRGGRGHLLKSLPG